VDIDLPELNYFINSLALPLAGAAAPPTPAPAPPLAFVTCCARSRCGSASCGSCGHTSAAAAPRRRATKSSGGATMAVSASRSDVRRRPGGLAAPAEVSMNLKFGDARGAPTRLVRLPSASTRRVTCVGRRVIIKGPTQRRAGAALPLYLLQKWEDIYIYIYI